MQKFNAISDTPKTNFVRLYLDLVDSVVALSHFLDQFIQYGDKVILSVKYFFKTSLTGTPMLRIFIGQSYRDTHVKNIYRPVIPGHPC